MGVGNKYTASPDTFEASVGVGNKYTTSPDTFEASVGVGNKYTTSPDTFSLRLKRSSTKFATSLLIKC